MMQGVVAAEETGGNPNFLGDKNSQGQYTAGGIGSWSNENAQGIPQALSSGGIPSNFQTQASALGLDPDNFSIDNQNQVLYGTLAQDKAQGLTPAQSLSKWNSGDPNAYQTSPVESSSVSSTGTSNVAAYVQRGLTAAQKYAQSQGKVAGASTSQGQGTASQFQGQTNAAGVSGIPSTPFQGSAPGGILGNVGANLQALPGQASAAIQSIFPNKTLGNAIGNTLAGPVGAAQAIMRGQPGQAIPTLQAGLGMAAQQNTPQNIGEGIIGNTIQDVTTPATLALGGGEGTTAAARIVNAGLKYGAGGAVGGAGQAMGQGASPGQVAMQAGESGLLSGLGAGVLQAGGEGISALAAKSNIQSIVDKLMPNMRSTGPEVRAAMNDGRIIDGTKSTFWGSTPDTIAPKAKTIVNAQTLEANIPGIASMSPQNMVRAIDDTTSAQLGKLDPVMQQIPISQADTGKIFEAATALKQAQQEAPAFYDSPSTARMQATFERYLKGLQWDTTDAATGKFKTPTPKTLADVVKVLRDYDGSVDDDIKNLGANADRTDKLQHKQWLQNRTLLSSMRDDLASKLAPDVQKTFKGVSNMLDARNSLVRNARITTKGSPGLVAKGLLKTAGLVGTGLGIGAGATGLLEHFLPSATSSQ